ncbi:MAG: DEAD/DEAH box helicase [Bacteroidota bacterium]|nr:DEAD/DEAH box helicase [Bacteroidota bacterium]
MSFENLNLIEPVLKALKEEGYSTPTPIQAQAIPIVLKQKDLLGCAQTGTGKTAAFAIPILQLLHESKTAEKKRVIKTLILTPTRELAIQIGESFASYGRYTGLKHKVIFGGVSQHSQVEALKSGFDILIATPGRLLDLMNQRFVDLQSIKIFVLDEADRMLDMGFIHDVKKVISKLPSKKQTLFFSATMPPEISKLASTILVNPERVEVTPVSSTANTIAQAVYFVDKENKKNLLNHILKDKSIKIALVFSRTKHGADKVVRELVKSGVTAQAIHGNKSQNARQNALNNFKDGKTRVLVASDIAARGIDIDDLTHVINYDLPNIPETYVHRIGRTGRAGASGIALSFCDAEEQAYLRDIHKLIGKTVPVIDEHPFPMMNKTFTKSKEQPQRRHSTQRSSNGNGNGNGNRNSSPKRGHSTERPERTARPESKPKTEPVAEAAPKRRSWFGRSRSNS